MQNRNSRERYYKRHVYIKNTKFNLIVGNTQRKFEVCFHKIGVIAEKNDFPLYSKTSSISKRFLHIITKSLRRKNVTKVKSLEELFPCKNSLLFYSYIHGPQLFRQE